MGKYGWRIRNYKAATILGKNTGIRDKYDYTEAMLHKSLFTLWLHKNGMHTGKKDESTQDIICIDFGFGLRSYKEEVKHIQDMRKKSADNPEKLQIIDSLEQKIHERKDLYRKISTDEIRRIFYEEGVSVTYDKLDKKTGEIISDTIKYRMLYRNPSKAKTGQAMFIREELYEKAYDWLTMGIGSKLPDHNAKIVEISAYAPLSTSAIEGTMHIPIEDVLVLEDQDSFFRTIADVVKAEDYEIPQKNGKTKTAKRCVVERKEVDVKNTLWDGMALIDSAAMPGWCNGMALLRNHFFKACAFKTHIQKFLRDYCAEHDIDYNSYQITDMFGNKHLAKNIKLITTDNAWKVKKFTDLIGGTLHAAYDYWCERVKADGCIWGIVKTDHPSKLGNVQQMSYQMINTLPCSQEDIQKIAQTSIDYVESLKLDNNKFEEYLRKNATAVNHFELLADLYAQNHEFETSWMWKTDKSKIINAYVARLRKGKITVEGDNLTVCGNPYGLLMHTVGLDWNDDPTLLPEEGAIQVYTKRFKDGEYLCGIRNPHNSSNNLGYFKNVKHPLMDKYFDFSNNIMAVNCIHTDVQARMNGEDFDSDFNFVTNQPQMVEAARIAYRDYPTVVNEIPESSITYDNTMAEYARMDTKMQNAQKAIGGSSDSAQLSQTYYWTKIARGEIDDECRQLYENTIILAVLAQVAIDGTKRVFAVDANDDIKRIRRQPCMNRDKDFPKFMKWTRDVKVTKNGKERPSSEIKKEKTRIRRRIDEDLICPMNWLNEALDKVQGMPKSQAVETSEFLAEKPEGKPYAGQMSRIRKIVEEYDAYCKYFSPIVSEDDESGLSPLLEKTEEVINNVAGMRIGRATLYRLVETTLGLEGRTRKDNVYRNAKKHVRKMLNILYRTNKDNLLNCFIKSYSHI